MFIQPYIFYPVLGVVVLLVWCLLLKWLTHKPSPAPIRGQHVLITGGSSGIGLATAKLCLREGASHVTILGSNPNRLETALDDLRRHAREGQLSGIAHDVGSPTVTAAIEAHAEAKSPVDILICSAGISRPALVDVATLEDFDAHVRINYLGLVYCVRAILPSMKRRKSGRIVFISSMAGLTGIVGMSGYTASKFAVRGFAESLAMELCPYDIGVSVVNPPDVDTPMFKEENKVKPQETKVVSEGSGLFTADEIATGIIKGIKSYRFFIQAGLDGWMLGMLTAGMAPATGVFHTTIEILFLGLFRFISLIYLKMFYRTCRKMPKHEVPSYGTTNH